jgi:hypothetical protein
MNDISLNSVFAGRDNNPGPYEYKAGVLLCSVFNYHTMEAYRGPRDINAIFSRFWNWTEVIG